MTALQTMTLPRPAPGMHVYFIDAGALLFCEARQEILALNTSAAFIWCHLVDGSSRASIEADLCSSFDLPPDKAMSFVETALSDWRERGFLADAASSDDQPLDSAEPSTAIPLPDGITFAVEHSYALLGSKITIRFATSEQAALVDPVLAHLTSVAGSADWTIDVVSHDYGIVLYQNGTQQLICSGLEEVAPAVKGLVWSAAINHYEFFIGFHAGVVGDRCGALLLAGPSGSGKSTLTATLVHAGYEYFSDEFALLRDGDLFVVPVPVSLCIKISGIGAVAKLYPDLCKLPVHKRFDGKKVVYLAPPRHDRPLPDKHYPVRAIVFPRFLAGSEASCHVLRKTEALSRLLTECLVVSGRLTAQRVQRLVDWITAIDCCELLFSNINDSILLTDTFLNEVRKSNQDGGKL